MPLESLRQVKAFIWYGIEVPARKTLKEISNLSVESVLAIEEKGMVVEGQKWEMLFNGDGDRQMGFGVIFHQQDFYSTSYPLQMNYLVEQIHDWKPKALAALKNWGIALTPHVYLYVDSKRG